MPNTNQIQIDNLRRIIFNALDKHITRDYCLLDVPNYKNIGDNLIWAGELSYLKRFPSEMVYSSNMYLFDEKKVPENSIILLQGGGNFGDLWRTSQEFRNRVIQRCSKNKIVIFPQTIHYTDKRLMEIDAKIFAGHKDLTICARDKVSFELLKENFYDNNIIQVPDMAFCLDLTEYTSNIKTGRTLVMQRNDKELSGSFDIKSFTCSIVKEHDTNIDIQDWPTYNLHRQMERMDAISDTIGREISQRLINVPIINRIIDSRYGLKRRDNLIRYLKMGIGFINRFDEVYSTRLHGFILSVLLNKKAHMIDNSYGKNSSFYDAWMNEFSNTFLIRSVNK